MSAADHKVLMRRTVSALALALVAVSVLSGCFGIGTRGGGTANRPDVETRTSSTVVAELEAVPGVEAGFVSTGPMGLPSQMELTIGLNLEAGYTGDLPALLDYALAMAWSTNVEEPTTVASVAFRVGATAVDLAPVAAELGWLGHTGPALNLSMDDMAERYGDWPGAVPQRPAALG